LVCVVGGGGGGGGGGKRSKWCWCGTFGISVSSSEGMSQQHIQNSVPLFGGQRQNTVLILFKKFLPASAIAIMSWQDVTRFSLCSVVKNCRTKHAQKFLFTKSSFRIWSTSLGDVQRFCYHSWCDSKVIFDQISNSSNVYLISSRL
jgi:hypothetical protein